MQQDLVCTLMAEDMATADEEMEMATEYRDEYSGEQLEKLDVLAEGCPACGRRGGATGRREEELGVDT